MTRILFVCTGNICRSPTAEAVMRHLVAEAGLGDAIDVDSAGISAWHAGEAPDVRSQQAAAARGYDMTGQAARQLHAADYDRFDMILAMDQGHLRDLQRHAPPDSRAHLALFLEHAPELGRKDVPDPYYGDDTGFGDVLDLVEAASRGLLRRLMDV